MRPTIFALIMCGTAAVLEGLAAGPGVKARFAELRLPRLSPPFAVWIAIGVGYYVICFFILRRLFSTALADDAGRFAVGLVGVMMIANAAWGVLFFRRRDLRLSFLAFPPYGVLMLVLCAVLVSADRTAAYILLPYLVYLVYATWWGYRLWRLNEPTGRR